MKLRPILVVGMLIGLGVIATDARAAEPKWGKVVDGLRCRFVPPNGTIAVGLAPTILIEVENASKKDVFWKCPLDWTGASGCDWHNGLDSPDRVVPEWEPRSKLPQGCARPGAGVRIASVHEYVSVWGGGTGRANHKAPMPGFFLLKPGARVSIVCVLPWKIENAGPHTVTGRLWRREIDMAPNTRRDREYVEESMMLCAPIRLNALTADAVRGVAAKEVAASRKALKDKDADVRLHAAVALGNLGAAAAAATPDLLHTLADADGHVRWCVVGALASVAPHDEKLVRALTGALADKEPEGRCRAAEALTTIGPKARSAVPALIRTLKRSCAEKHTDWYIRDTIVRALGSVREAAVPFLIEALSDEDREVRCGLIRALGIVGVKSKDVMPALMGMTNDEDLSVRAHVARAFGRIGPAAVPGLIRMLGDKTVTCEAARALGDLGPAAKDAVPQLIQALKDKRANVRQFAATALGQIGPAAREAIPSLTDALKSKNEHVRAAAEKALKAIQSAPEPK